MPCNDEYDSVFELIKENEELFNQVDNIRFKENFEENISELKKVNHSYSVSKDEMECFYIYRKLDPLNLKITTIARGIAIGDELEYADEVTLGRSILNRVDFTVSFK